MRRRSSVGPQAIDSVDLVIFIFFVHSLFSRSSSIGMDIIQQNCDAIGRSSPNNGCVILLQHHLKLMLTANCLIPVTFVLRRFMSVLC